jgi:MscS family membrane protein
MPDSHLRSRRPRRARSGGWLVNLIALVLLAGAGGALDRPVVAASLQDGGAAEPAPVDPGLASPRDALETFVTAMGAEPPDLERARDCLELDAVARDATDDLAIRLYRILNRIEWIDFEADASLPGPTDVAEWPDDQTTWRFFPRESEARRGSSMDLGVWLTNRTRRDEVRTLAPAARIELHRGVDGAWRFSAATVASIEQLWAVLSPLDPVLLPGGGERLTVAERIQQLFPATLRTGGVLGVEPWQWASLAILIFLGLSLDLIVRLLLASLSRRIICRRGGEVEAQTLRRAVRPFGMAAAAIFWLQVIKLLGLPNHALLVLGPAIRLYAMLAFVWAAFRVTDVVGEYFAGRAAATENRFDDLVVPLLRKTVKIIIGIFGLIYIAASFDVEIGPLVAGLGIGGVGFAFAAKDTLENIFGSVTVILDRPFQVGDWVVIGETEGTVEELGLRSVRVRTFYNSLVTIPTANLVRARVDNYGQRKYRRWKTHLNIMYETSPDRVEAFCEGIRELIRLHPYTRKDYYQVWLHQFGPHSIDILVYMFFEAPEWSTELRERHRLMLDIMRMAERIGVQFAYPTQRLVLERGTPAETADGLPEADAAVDPLSYGHDVLARRRGRQLVREMTRDERWRRRVPPPHRFSAGDELDDEEAEDGGTPDSQIESRIGGDG